MVLSNRHRIPSNHFLVARQSLSRSCGGGLCKTMKKHDILIFQWTSWISRTVRLSLISILCTKSRIAGSQCGLHAGGSFASQYSLQNGHFRLWMNQNEYWATENEPAFEWKRPMPRDVEYQEIVCHSAQFLFTLRKVKKLQLNFRFCQ